MSHDLGHMTKATRARGERALQHVMGEIVELLREMPSGGE
jgi:creatinine amidohydrolase/Fe(II)-dependent formamide hydrolase-like protein